jgi:hypothetical protein
MPKVDRVNQLNRSFTVIFTDAMKSLKPLKDTQKIQNNKPADPDAEKYSQQIEKWQDAFNFDQELRKYVNKLSNLIVLAGGSNSSDGADELTQESIQLFDLELNSKNFEKNMASCKPRIEEDPDYAEKIIMWKKAFSFPTKLTEFIKKLKTYSFPIPAEKYLELVDDFIKGLQVDDDEFLIKNTQNIGGQEYKIDSDTIEMRAESEIDLLVKDIKAKSNAPPEYKRRFETDTDIFIKTMKDAKTDELEIKAEKKIVEKKYNNTKLEFDIDEELVKKGAKAVKKMFPKYMNGIALGSIIAILGLVILSVWCPVCTFESAADGLKTVETVEISENGNTKTTTIDVYNEPQSTSKLIEIPLFGTIEIPLSGYIGNPYTQILESNVVVILISTFVAPVAAKLLKEKFDIDITEKQVDMIVNDGIKSVTMYSNEADKLRDANGHIPRKYQKTLRDKAFNALRENYDKEKYKELAANVGAQIFDKAIENAVTSGRLERFPLEKKQIEELIKQSIDAVPAIVEWQKLDDKVKIIFIDGNIRKLLQNTGINGWSYKALETVFDAEVSKRILGAALIQKDSLFDTVESSSYLQYTSTAIDALLERKA